MRNSTVPNETLEQNEESFFFMANLHPKRTGLPFVIWISEQSGREGHDVRVKVSLGPRMKATDPLISVGLRPQTHIVEGKMNAAQFGLLKQWIELNREILIAYWEGRLDTGDFIEKIKKV